MGTDAIAGPGRVFPLLGEEGDYYKVSTLGKWCDIESAYILKSDVGEIEMKPITADMLEGDGEESSLTYRVIKDGKYKDIVIGYEYDELNGETLQVGLLRDGALVTPVTYMIDSQMSTELNDIEITESDGTFSLKYGQSMSVVTDEETNSRQLDIKKLSNKQIEKIIDTVTKKKPEYVECMYHFPAMGVRMFYYKTK